jgi:hypothetical protein
MPRPTTADGYVDHVGHHYPFVSSHAPPILHRRKRVVEAMWGRLLTCGRLLIGLLTSPKTPSRRRHVGPEPVSLPEERRLPIAEVAVGTTVTHRPPHRSVRALLTHTALISDVGVSPVDGLTHALNAVYTVVRYCARSVCRFIAFSLIHRLPSSSSAGFPLGSEPSSVLRGSPTSQRRT